jgi:ribosomal protein S17E
MRHWGTMIEGGLNGTNRPSIKSRPNGSAGTPSTLDEESFKQALSQFLVDFFSSKHLDQGVDILTQCLSKPLDILTLLKPNVKKDYPEFYNLFKDLHNDKDLSKLGFKINSNFKELHRLLHQTISDNNPKKLSNELAGFLTKLILTDKSQPENKSESEILSDFMHDINTIESINPNLVLCGLKLMFTKPHFLNDVMNSWQNFCENLKIDIDPALKIISCILGKLSKKNLAHLRNFPFVSGFSGITNHSWRKTI